MLPTVLYGFLGPFFGFAPYNEEKFGSSKAACLNFLK